MWKRTRAGAAMEDSGRPAASRCNDCSAPTLAHATDGVGHDRERAVGAAGLNG